MNDHRTESVNAEIRYEIRLASSATFTIAGKEFSAIGNDDIAVMVRLTISCGGVIDERIVGVIGDAHLSSARELVILSKFMSAGGVITLSHALDI